MKIMSDKEWNRFKDYVTTLENQLKALTTEHDKLKKEHEELSRKYKKLKMEAFLKS